MVFEEVLAIQVGIQGIEQVKAGFEAIAERAKVADAAVKTAAVGFAQLGTALAIAFAGVREAMGEERYTMQLKALVTDSKALASIMKDVRGIAEGGIFTEDEAFQAALAMERLGASSQKYLKIAYDIAGRSAEPGALGNIAAMIGRIEGGDTQMLRRPMRTLGITPDMLASVGIKDIDKASKTQLLAGLEAIAAKMKDIRLANEGTFSAEWMRSIDRFKEGLQVSGENFMKIFRPVLHVLNNVMWLVQEIDTKLGGWGSTTLVTLMAINGIAKVLPAIVTITRTLLSLEAIRAIWAKAIATYTAIAALVSGPAGPYLAIGALALLGVGAAGYMMSNNGSGSSGGGQTGQKTGVRRADYENFMNDRMANSLG